jgi:hypothetical protein
LSNGSSSDHIRNDINAALVEFCRSEGIRVDSYSAVCALLFVTRKARRLGLPLLPQQLIARSGAQVAGLHAGAVRTILREHGVQYQHLGEAGRTTTSNAAYATAYASMLNEWVGLDDSTLQSIEAWWIDHLPARALVPSVKLRWRTRKSSSWLAHDLLAQVSRKVRPESCRSTSRLLVAGLAAALLTYRHKLNTGTDELADILVAADSRQEIQVSLAGTTAIVSDFPSQSTFGSIREIHRQRRCPLLIVPQDAVDGSLHAITSAGLSETVDVLSIEQWLAIATCDFGTGRQTRRGQVIEEIVHFYTQCIESSRLDCIPRLTLA